MNPFALQQLLRVTALLVLVTFQSYSANGFTLPENTDNTNVVLKRYKEQHTTTTTTELQMSAPEREALDFSRARNEGRTDVRNLLTQRSIQSFIFLANSLRDPHSCRWIEDFLETNGQLEYHGTGAGYMERFGGTWDAPLLEMVEQPKHTLTISAKRRGKGQKGWSKNNPYLEDKFFNFTVDIDPASLVTRILSVREQIAKEWIDDLQVLDAANDMILESYFSQIEKDQESQNSKTDNEDDDEDDDNDEDEPHDSAPTVSSPSFERVMSSLLHTHTAFRETLSSPLRRGNFDLLYNICTQESIHRILRQSSSTETRRNVSRKKGADDVTLEWLREFYSDRVAKYFDGNQPYGQADEFMDELLSASPRMILLDGDHAVLTDPMRMAERIMDERKVIVTEWKKVMKKVPSDHTDGIRKLLLNKQMEKYNNAQVEEDDFESSGFQ